jgi:hypothetical protein
MAEAFKHQAHVWDKWQGIPWLVCNICGLVRLRNPITEWCDKHGCNHDEHPGYRKALERLCKPTAQA